MGAVVPELGPRRPLAFHEIRHGCLKDAHAPMGNGRKIVEAAGTISGDSRLSPKPMEAPMRGWFARKWVSRVEYDNTVSEFQHQISDLQEQVLLNRQALEALVLVRPSEPLRNPKPVWMKRRRKLVYRHAHDNVIIAHFRDRD